MKTKRFAALVATGLLSVQMFGVGIAQAANSVCDFGSDDLEVTIDDVDVALQMDGEFLECDDNYDGTFDYTDFIAVASLDTIVVEMDDDETSDGELFLILEDYLADDEPGDWPSFSAFDIDVTTRVHVDASAMEANDVGVRVTVGAKSVAFSGTTATSNAPSYEILGSDGRDTIDGSKATVKLEISGDEGGDSIKGGTARDDISGGAGSDVIFGGAGNDVIDGNDDGDADQCWGQDGDDYLKACFVVAPGAGDDEIDSLGEGEYGQRVTYQDLTAGITFTQTNCSGKTTTGGAAGNDLFDDAVSRITGTPGDDFIADACGSNYTVVTGGDGNDTLRIYASYRYGPWGAFGGNGDDVISEYNAGGGSHSGSSSRFVGGAGDDLLKGGYGSDTLLGGPGADTIKGGPSIDVCATGEVYSSCEQIGRGR